MQLARLVPTHVGESFNADVQQWVDTIEARLGSIRSDVELTKRSVGLLRNSRRAIVTLMNLVDEQLSRAVKENSGSEVAVHMGLAQQLHQRIAIQAPSPDVLVQSMQEAGLVSMKILAPLVQHLGIIDEYLQPLNAASERLYRAIGSLDQVARSVTAIPGNTMRWLPA